MRKRSFAFDEESPLILIRSISKRWTKKPCFWLPPQGKLMAWDAGGGRIQGRGLQDWGKRKFFWLAEWRTLRLRAVVAPLLTGSTYHLFLLSQATVDIYSCFIFLKYCALTLLPCSKPHTNFFLPMIVGGGPCHSWLWTSWFQSDFPCSLHSLLFTHLPSSAVPKYASLCSSLSHSFLALSGSLSFKIHLQWQVLLKAF